MVLRISKFELHDKLTEHKDEIGNGPIYNAIGNVTAGVFYLPAAYVSNCAWATYGLLFLAILFLGFGGWTLYKAIKNRYTAEDMYKDIVAMDRTERESSIIAVRDATGEFKNRYLVFFDNGWQCDFFPYHKTVDPVEVDLEQVAQYLSDAFEISRNDFTIQMVGQQESAKPSTEHGGEKRWYVYRLYKADVTRMPDAWRADSFTVGSKQCRWMTTDDMMKNPRIMEVNRDVVGMVRGYLN